MPGVSSSRGAAKELHVIRQGRSAALSPGRCSFRGSSSSGTLETVPVAKRMLLYPVHVQSALAKEQSRCSIWLLPSKFLVKCIHFQLYCACILPVYISTRLALPYACGTCHMLCKRQCVFAEVQCCCGQSRAHLPGIQRKKAAGPEHQCRCASFLP